MEVPLPRPASVSQPKDLLMMDSHDVSFLDQLDSRSQIPSYVEPVQQHQPPEVQKPTEVYPSLPSPRVETPVNNTVPVVPQEPVQVQAPTHVALPEQHNLYKIDSPRERPAENYRTEIRVPSYVEPPKEKPVELYRGYPTLETPAVASSPVYTPMRQQQQQYAVQQQMPTIQLPSSQQVNQVVQTQQNISAIHTMSSQHIQQTKDMVVKFESYFDRMINWMESIDRRLSKLELTTNELQKNQQTIQQKLNSSPAPSSSTPSMVPYFLPAPSALSTTSVPTASAQETLHPYEYESAMKLQQTLDSDAEMAKKLQAEFEQETKTVAKKPEPKVTQEDCPICQKKVSSKEFNDHVNECLDKASKEGGNTAQSGFFSRFFSKKTDTPTPAPEKTEVPLVKKPTTTPSTQTPAQITPPPMYPAFQPYMMPQPVQGTQGKPATTPTPYFFPQYPFQQGQGQPVYYIPQGYPYAQAQGQPQPKK